jgi:hypothetical protein
MRRKGMKATAVPIAATTTIALFLVLPAAASAATQTLTVEKSGTGTGTVTSSPAGINCGATCSFAFAEGALVTLTATPTSGTAPVVWAGCETITTEKKCKVTMSAAKTVKATFNLLKRQLKVEKKGTGTGTVTSSPAGIDCGQTCSAEYDNGVEVTLTGAAGANTEAVKWAGCTSVDGENHCKVAMSSAKTVTATFNLHKLELKVSKGGVGTGTVKSSPTGIECGFKCSFLFDEGSTVTLTGTPGANTQAVKWSGCGSVNAEDKCLVTMNAARSVTAIFNVEGPQLSVTKLGSGTGTVTSSPAGIVCGESCAVNFLKETTVTLTGTPGLHSEAVKWAGCDSEPEGKCVVAMDAAKSVIAAFELEPQWIEYTVTVQLKGTGKGSVTSVPGGIECGSDCSQTYLNKTPVTLIATPAPGSVFDHWGGGGCTGSGPCERKINSSRLVKAVFTAVGNRTLTVAKVGTGQGTVTSKPAGIECGATCSAELDASTKVVLKATPAAGSTFAGFSGEGCSGTTTCRVLMNEARNVTASFTANPAPPAPKCLVPQLKGKTLARARSALTAAHCSLGKVRKPKGAKLAKLRVRSSSPAAGTRLPSGAKVNVRLAPARGR